MARIHHATAKKAAAHGLAIVENGTSFEIRTVDGGHLVDAASDPKVALDAAIESVNSEFGDDGETEFADALAAFVENAAEQADEDAANEDEDEDGEDGEGDGKSIVKRSYKKAYKPFRNTCGDDFADLMDKAVKVATIVDGKSVKRIDFARLRKLAVANEAWDDRYDYLNPGQARMNVGNRLRAKIKHGVEVKWI